MESSFKRRLWQPRTSAFRWVVSPCACRAFSCLVSASAAAGPGPALALARAAFSCERGSASPDPAPAYAAFSWLVSAAAHAHAGVAAQAPVRLLPVLLSVASAIARAPIWPLPVLLSAAQCLRARRREPRSGSCPCCFQLVDTGVERGSASTGPAPAHAAFSCERGSASVDPAPAVLLLGD